MLGHASFSWGFRHRSWARLQEQTWREPDAAKLAERMSDTEASARAAAAALSTYFEGPASQEGLVLGYAGHDDAAIEMAERQLAKVLRR